MSTRGSIAQVGAFAAYWLVAPPLDRPSTVEQQLVLSVSALVFLVGVRAPVRRRPHPGDHARVRRDGVHVRGLVQSPLPAGDPPTGIGAASAAMDGLTRRLVARLTRPRTAMLVQAEAPAT